MIHGALTDIDAFMNSATQNIISFSAFTQSLIIYSCMFFMGIVDGLWKKSIGIGVVTSALGILTAYTILNPSDIVIFTTQLIEKKHLNSLFSIETNIKIVKYLILAFFLKIFFNSEEIGRGRPSPFTVIFLLLLLFLFFALHGIMLNSFWLGIVTISASVAVIGYLWWCIKKLFELRKMRIIEKEKAALKQKMDEERLVH